MMHFGARAWLLLFLLSLAGGCQREREPASSPAADVSPPELGKIEATGLHNVYRITDKLYSGSSPEGDEGFRSLKELGVKTIISVDGARPDVARAGRHGMRYVHLPIGYDGVPREQALRIAKVVCDLPGPVYLHCHHGKHRGPAAAAVAHMCLDETCSVETVVSEMRRAGTDPRYTGLYAAPRKFQRPTNEEWDHIPTDFPEVAKVAALAQVMVGVDERWEHLKQIRTAGWKAPSSHPDLDPPHEALQLAEHYREAARLPQMRERPEEFRRWLVDAVTEAHDLERVLRMGKEKGTVDATAAEHAFRKAGRACTQCHAKYRDVPRGR